MQGKLYIMKRLKSSDGVELGQPPHGLENFPTKSQIFQFFYHQVKKYQRGQLKKYPGQGRKHLECAFYEHESQSSKERPYFYSLRILWQHEAMVAEGGLCLDLNRQFSDPQPDAMATRPGEPPICISKDLMTFFDTFIINRSTADTCVSIESYFLTKAQIYIAIITSVSHQYGNYKVRKVEVREPFKETNRGFRDTMNRILQNRTENDNN